MKKYEILINEKKIKNRSIKMEEEKIDYREIIPEDERADFISDLIDDTFICKEFLPESVTYKKEICGEEYNLVITKEELLKYL